MSHENIWDVVVVGGAYTDYTARGPELPKPGGTVKGDVFLQYPGGKGANQAVAAARLGARVVLIARVGTDARGDEIVTSFADEGVDTRYIIRDSAEPTGASLIQVDQKGQKQILLSLGVTHRLSASDVHAAEEAIKAAKVLLTQLEIPLETAMAAVHLGHVAGAKVIFDPAPPLLLSDELLRQVDVIKPDSKEAEAITGVQVQDRASARKAAEILLRRGVKAAAVQAGDEGNLIVWREGECWLPEIPVKRVDPTGAGDVFAASLAAKLARGHSLQEAGPFANAAAALTTTKLGARPSLPYYGEVEQLLEDIKSTWPPS